MSVLLYDIDMPNPLAKLSELIEYESLLRYEGAEAIKQRVETILNNSSAYRKMGALAIHHLAGVKLINQMSLTKSLTPFIGKGYAYIGSGAHSTVWKSNDQVLKIERSSRHMNDARRQRLEEGLRESVSRLMVNYQDVAVDTSVGQINIGPDTYVALNQPHIDGVCAVFPTPHPLVFEFAEKIMDTKEADGLVPDITGRRNLLVSRNEELMDALNLVDTAPMTLRTTNPGIYARNMQNIESLARGRNLSE